MSRPHQGFTPATTKVIKARSGNICEVQVDPQLLLELFPDANPVSKARWQRFQGCIREAIHKHHRRNRAAGSTKRPASNQPSASLHACLLCHTFIGAEPAVANPLGWLVGQSEEPASKPVLYRGVWVLLDDNGGFTRCAGPTTAEPEAS